MTLNEALKDIQQTKRSRLFVFTCKAGDTADNLKWLKNWYGDKTIKEMVEG